MKQVPDDINEFLNTEVTANYDELLLFLREMNLTIEQTRQADEPELFAYGKLLKTAGSNNEIMDEPKRVRLLTAAIWELTRGRRCS